VIIARVDLNIYLTFEHEESNTGAETIGIFLLLPPQTGTDRAIEA
jgi:hypothetical protein